MKNTTTCPRCGQPTIEVKDWGKAGTLFVHSKKIEKGIPMQDACHVHADELAKGLKWTRKG